MNVVILIHGHSWACRECRAYLHIPLILYSTPINAYSLPCVCAIRNERSRKKTGRERVMEAHNLVLDKMCLLFFIEFFDQTIVTATIINTTIAVDQAVTAFAL